MRLVNALQGQTIFDIAVMSCGDVAAACDIARLNGISETVPLIKGTAIALPDVVNRKVVSYYVRTNIVPATEYTR